MLDLYPRIETVKISPEAPVIDSVIHSPIHLWSAKRGGAGNVAENFAALREDVTLIGIIGDDSFGSMLQNVGNQVHNELIVCKDIMTTTKIRLMKGSGHIHRISYESKPEASIWIDGELVKEVIRKIPRDKDTIYILVDYNKGMFTFDFKGKHQSISEMLNIPSTNLYVMPKPTNISQFHSVHSVAMNKKEYEDSQIEDFDDFGWKHVLVTEGAKGLTVYDIERNIGQHIPAHKVDVVDTCGAGDSASATFFWALAQGYSPYIAGHIANYAGALAVQQIGCYHVSIDELIVHFPFLKTP